MTYTRIMGPVLALGSAIAMSGCFGGDADMVDPSLVHQGDMVDVTYTLTWSDGTVFATNKESVETQGQSTYSLDKHINDHTEAGDKNTIWGESLVGKRLEDTVSAIVSPETSGESSYYSLAKVQKLSGAALGNESVPTVGDIYDIGGQQAYITNIEGKGNDATITLDLNPRETRDSYTYDVTITNIQ